MAAGQVPDVTFVPGDLRTFDLQRTFDLITCVFDSLNNLVAEGDLLAALKRAQAHLAPGGLLAFDVNTRLGVRELWEGDSIEGLEALPDGSRSALPLVTPLRRRREAGGGAGVLPLAGR